MYAGEDEGIFGNESYWNGNCQIGQLTKLGGEMCTRMGAALRQVYVDTYHLLPEALTQNDLGYFRLRSTIVPRAQESILSMLEGLYPADKRPGVYIPITLYSEERDYAYPNALKCPRITQVLINNIVQNPEWLPRMQAIKDVLDQINTIANTTDDPSMNDQYTVGSWDDVFRARLCNDLPLPCSEDGQTCVTQEMADTVLEVGNWETPRLFGGDELALLGGGPLFCDISKTFADRVSTGSGPKYIHYSAHDTTLYSLLAGLKFLGNYTPFASTIRFELWQTSNDPTPEYGVQIIFNNEIIRPPECGDDLCTLKQFEDMISSRLTIRDLAKECALEQ